MATAVADLCDANFDLVQAGTVRALNPGLIPYGGKMSCQGRVVTLKVFEDNTLVRQEVEKEGSGKVLIIDGGCSMRCALFGGNLASLAAQNHWSGVIIYGCVRDVEEIKRNPMDIRALGSTPIKSVKKGVGESGVPISVGGVRITPGEWCYGDSDGIVISETELKWP